MARADILIKGGTVIDPARGVSGIGDVVIRGGVIADPGKPVEVDQVIDATGFIVTPGLIDNHTHLFHGATEFGFVPDLALLPMGVTTAIDAGSAGAANCDAFIREVVRPSRMRVLCQLNVSPTGQITERYPENLDPKNFDAAELSRLLGKYPGAITGLKIRCGAEVVGAFGLDSLRAAVATAESVGCCLTVHTANPPGDIDGIADMLRAGDVFCHCYHGQGSTIIDADGKVRERIREARRRGVIFDTADARVNHSYRVIRSALADDFPPDVISTDLTQMSLFGNMVFGLPVVMSKYLGLGLSLDDVVNACTAIPAEINGLKGKIGTLAPGAAADVSIFALEDRKMTLQNRLGESFVLEELLVPKLTIFDGTIVFRQVDYPF